MNFVRVRATEKYMRDCHEVFAVTTIFRPITDVAIKDIIHRCGSHRPLRVVCTHSEVHPFDQNPKRRRPLV